MNQKQPPNFVEEVHNQWDTIDQVLVEIMKEGFYPLDTPRYAMPMLTTESLTHFNPEQYGILIAQYEGWKSYTDSKLSIINGGILQCENEMDDIAVTLREEIRKSCEQSGEKKPAEERIKDMIKGTPRYRQLKLDHQKLVQAKALLQVHLDRLGRGLALLSRNIEMKKIEMGLTGRNAY